MELLLNTLKWSAVVGAAALVLWLLKPRMDRRYSPKWRYWAWLGLAAALLLATVPWGKLLPEETAIAAPVVVEVPYYQVTVGDMTGLRAQSYREGDDPQTVLSPDRGEGSLFNASSREELAAAYRTSGVVITAETALTALWLAGGVCFLLYHAVGSWLFLRRRRRWSLPPGAELAETYEALAGEMGIAHPPALRLCREVGSPMVAGLLRPTLLLPETAAEGTALPFILRHELTHYKRRDLWYQLLLLLAAAVHWFNPLAHLMRRWAASDLELTCDEAVMAGADAAVRRSYGEALLASLHRQKGLERAALSTHFYGGAAAMRDRLWNLLGSGARKRGALALAAVLILTLLAACAVRVSQTQPPVEEPLTAEELADWQEKLSSRELNGFVIRLYTDVRYLPLYEVFYNGAGISCNPTDEEYEAIRDDLGDDPDTDITVIRDGDVAAFLDRYTGYTEEDFRCGLRGWRTLEDHDARYTVHGDTNYCGVNVLSGTKQGDTVTLELELPGGNGSGGVTGGTMTIEDGKIRSFTNPLYSAVEAMAWNYVDTAARNLETNDWITPAEGGTVPEGTKVLDRYISGLWSYSSYEIDGKTWSVWWLEYRLKPEDMSKVIFAGGMSEENGWVTESSSMGSPIFIVSEDGQGTVKLEESTYDGTVRENGWTWEEYIACRLVLGMDIGYRLGGWPEIDTPFLLDLKNGHNTWAMDWQDTARSYLVQAGYVDAGELRVTRTFDCETAWDCDQSMLAEADWDGKTITLFMSHVTYNDLPFWQVNGVLTGDGSVTVTAGETFYQKADFTLAPGKTADLGLDGKKLSNGNYGISKVQVFWNEEPGGAAFFTREAIAAQWGEDSKDYYTESPYEDGGLVLEDFNFDGYTDIGLQGWISASNLPRYLWLYRPETGSFQYALCVNGELTLDPGTRTLTAVSVDQAGSIQYQERYQPDETGMLYLARWDALRYENGKYVPQSSETYDREGNVISSGVGKMSVRTAYRQVLESFLADRTLPLNGEDWSVGAEEDLTKNLFSILDVDGDGREELLLEYVTAQPMAGLTTIVYDYRDGELVTEFSEFPDLTFYGNGVVTAGWSHSQGLAGDSFWPYTLYRYDAATDAYVRAGMVDAWDKTLRNTDAGGDPFPDDVDKDGDGLVYYIMTGGMYERKDPVDGPDHQAWLESYTAGSQPMEILFLSLTEENLALIEYGDVFSVPPLAR